MSDVRCRIVKRFIEDLVGPFEPEEVIDDRPGDRYLTGILFPPKTEFGADQDDEAETAEEDDGTDQGSEAVPAANSTRPSTAGVSFALLPEEGSLPAVTIRIGCARYVRKEVLGNDDTNGEAENKEVDGPVPKRRKAGKRKYMWHRLPQFLDLTEIPLDTDDATDENLNHHGLPGLSLHLRTTPWQDRVLVTAVLSNSCDPGEIHDRTSLEENTFFQVSMSVEPACGSRLVPRPAGGAAVDDDARVASLIYRDVAVIAVGHTCSAEWEPEEGEPQQVSISWIPRSLVRGTSADGHRLFGSLNDDPGCNPLSANWLASAEDDELVIGLKRVTGAYRQWIEGLENRKGSLPEELREQADIHIERCISAWERMSAGIEQIKVSHEVRDAFRLANQAMAHQFVWASGSEVSLSWRPFQIAFALMVLPSVANPMDEHRLVADLLWFPTGGGKTEAYFLITAFAIFLRRLRNPGTVGAGVTVFMRYTLRLLTVQQFQRAASMICACELLRIGVIDPGKARLPESFASDKPISLGLWVGAPSTPNTIRDAITALSTGDESTPAQLKKCPSCGGEIEWALAPDEDAIWATCTTEGCDLASHMSHLPVWTVDEDVYRETPSLLIGTADKYTQITRKRETGRLFGIETENGPPDVIVQDELHLISGPLGTLAGIYEIAIDEFCARAGARPKVIGSTATIRRAEDQIKALFDRQAFQFPPPGFEHDDSGFAVADPDAPGRLHVGVTTAGRSAKFALQAVCASLLQSASDPKFSVADRDWYWTLVAYFNSLRELGGAVVLMQDDVDRSLQEFARRRAEQPRTIETPTELTGRVDSSQIPELLDQLMQDSASDSCVDVVLASNMISVGVDIGRLGLMVVNGQPKGIAEYIQATSRVGRGRVPGLVVTLYNANKARDRSHYERFSNWHMSLYRDVEATSVTPFAPRARDRALHAPFVAMARHLLPALRDEPVNIVTSGADLEDIIERIIERTRHIDPEEEDGVRLYLERKLQQWNDSGPHDFYWDDFRNRGLLMSAEKAAERAAAGRRPGSAWPTPNSLRSVEASVEYVLRPFLRPDAEQ